MNEQQTPLQTQPVAEEEIDFISLVKEVWDGRRTIILSVIFAAVLGILVALLSIKEYTATSVMVPQIGSDDQSKLGGLGGLAALAGITLDLSQNAELSPLVYPLIISSIPFQLELINAPLNFQNHPVPIDFYDYYYREPSFQDIVKKWTIGLPGILIKAIKGKPKELILPANITNQPIHITEDQYEVIEALGELISLDVDAKNGYLTLTAQMPEPLVAAQLAQKAQDLLQRYITEFKIEKVKDNLTFIQQRYDEIKAEFEKAQISLAIATDRNKNFTSGLSQIEIDRINTRYTLAFSVYQDLSKQLEQAKIQVKKETPVFTIVEPVTIPSITDGKPSRTIIVAIFIFLGGIVGILIIFSKHFLVTLKQKWQEVPEK
jgi:hypothetical protein